MNHLDLAHIESSVVEEMARLLDDCTHSRPRVRFRLTGAQVDSIEAQIGPRLTRLALGKADFRPEHGDSPDWLSVSSIKEIGKPVTDLHPEDFWIALEDLDVDQRLAKALGLA